MNGQLTEKELVNWLKLTNIKYLGPQKLLRLFTTYKSIDAVFLASDEELLATRIFNHAMLEELKHQKGIPDERYSKVIDFCKGCGIKLLPLIQDDYPQRLKKISNPPLTLFLWGNEELLNSTKTFAIVGSREVSEKAVDFAYSAGKALAGEGYIIISGGAKGTDTAAHKGALASNGKTIAVLGSGFSNMYPEENIPLFDQIRKDGGLLVSEHSPNFSGSRISYLQRNRITSALSDGLLLCANERKDGGAMTQVKLAHSQGVPLFCRALILNVLPNEGIDAVIRDFKAKEIKGADEILDILSRKKDKITLEAFA